MGKLFKALLATAAVLQAGTAHAAWNEAISKHFHVYADESPDDIRAFATKLERFDAAVREARGKPDRHDILLPEFLAPTCPEAQEAWVSQWLCIEPFEQDVGGGLV